MSIHLTGVDFGRVLVDLDRVEKFSRIHENRPEVDSYCAKRRHFEGYLHYSIKSIIFLLFSFPPSSNIHSSVPPPSFLPFPLFHEASKASREKFHSSSFPFLYFLFISINWNYYRIINYDLSIIFLYQNRVHWVIVIWVQRENGTGAKRRNFLSRFRDWIFCE